MFIKYIINNKFINSYMFKIYYYNYVFIKMEIAVN